MDTTFAESILTPDLATRGPNVIGATGGSGTRVLAQIVRSAGMYTGNDLNAYEDALPFGAYSDRWINRFVSTEGPDPALRAAMLEDLENLVRSHCAAMPAAAPRWGWKEPRSIYLLPVYSEAMPSIRFLHFIRDGRDMAFSDNQQQLTKHGRSVLGGGDRFRRWARSIRLWTIVNNQAADFGEQHLGDRYLRVRFEDLCAAPRDTLERVFEFFALEGDAAAASEVVRPPSTLGRWRSRSPRVVDRLNELGSPALERFGYLDD